MQDKLSKGTGNFVNLIAIAGAVIVIWCFGYTVEYYSEFYEFISIEHYVNAKAIYSLVKFLAVLLVVLAFIAALSDTVINKISTFMLGSFEVKEFEESVVLVSIWLSIPFNYWLSTKSVNVVFFLFFSLICMAVHILSNEQNRSVLTTLMSVLWLCGLFFLATIRGHIEAERANEKTMCIQTIENKEIHNATIISLNDVMVVAVANEESYMIPVRRIKQITAKCTKPQTTPSPETPRPTTADN